MSIQPICVVCLNPLSNRKSGDSYYCKNCKMWRGRFVRYADYLAEVERVRDEWMRYTNRCEYKATEAERERIVQIINASVMLAKPEVLAHLNKLMESIKGDRA